MPDRDGSLALCSADGRPKVASDTLTRVNDPQRSRATSNGFAVHAVARAPSEEVEQLRAALVSNRRIGMAMGILMRDRNVDEDQAFAYLRRVSQDSNRKLRDVADDVITYRRSCPAWSEPRLDFDCLGSISRFRPLALT